MCDARDRVVRDLGGFAKWFRRHLLSPRLRQIRERHKWIADWATGEDTREAPATTVGLVYMASREMLERAEHLDKWLKERVDGEDHDRAHAGWVALRESRSFFHPHLRSRLTNLGTAFSAYRVASGQEEAQGTPAPSGAKA
jgi:hypothetical protein